MENCFLSASQSLPSRTIKQESHRNIKSCHGFSASWGICTSGPWYFNQTVMNWRLLSIEQVGVNQLIKSNLWASNISCLFLFPGDEGAAMPAAHPHSWNMGPAKAGGTGHASPSSATSPCSQWAHNATVFYRWTKQFCFFFFWVFCFLPIVHSESACPPTPHPPPRLPMLLTQALLCLLAHKYLQFRASMVPSTNRKEYSWESSVSLPYGSGALLPMQTQTHWAEGHLVREWLEQDSKEKVLQINSCVENVPNIIVQPSSLKDWCKTVWPLISSVNLDWFPDIPCLAALLPITNHRKTTLFSQAAYKTCRLLCAPVKKGSPSPCMWENTAASLSFCTVT